MECAAIRDMLFRRIDNELSEVDKAEFDAHLANCSFCAREYRLLSLPSRMAPVIPPLEPSPYFYRKLKANLDQEVQKAAGWQVFFGLARRVIPALAGVTLALLSVFAYVQMRGNDSDFYKAYNRVFIAEDQPHRMLPAEQGEITDDSMLSAFAERDSNHGRNENLK